MFKLTIPCSHCMNEAQQGKVGNSKFYSELTLTDSTIYDVACPNGHNYLVRLNQFKFEMLFDIGVHAIKDGYYREGISSFSASLERTYEAITKIILLKQGMPYEKINEFWTPMTKRSEVQFGAFMGAYLSTMKEVPKYLREKDTKTRNDVIHKGKFPSKDEVMGYGQAVLDIIDSLTDLMHTRLSDATQVYREELLKEDDPNGKVNLSYDYPTLIYGSHDTGRGRNTLADIVSFLEMKSEVDNMFIKV